MISSYHIEHCESTGRRELVVWLLPPVTWRDCLRLAQLARTHAKAISSVRVGPALPLSPEDQIQAVIDGQSFVEE